MFSSTSLPFSKANTWQTLYDVILKFCNWINRKHIHANCSFNFKTPTCVCVGSVARKTRRGSIICLIFRYLRVIKMHQHVQFPLTDAFKLFPAYKGTMTARTKRAVERGHIIVEWKCFNLLSLYAVIKRVFYKWKDNLSSTVRSKGCQLKEVTCCHCQLLIVTKSDENLISGPPHNFLFLLFGNWTTGLVSCPVPRIVGVYFSVVYADSLIENANDQYSSTENKK